MKIVFFTNNMDKGGAQRVISVLSERFCRMGHDVRILVVDGEAEIAYGLYESVRLVKLNEGAKPDGRLRALFGKIGYRIQRTLLKKQRDYLQEKEYYSRKADLVKRYFRANPADVIYSFLVEPNIMLGLASGRIAAKIVMAERNFPDKPQYTESFKRLRDACYARADCCVFQTEEQRAMFSGKVREKSVVIFNPIKENLPGAFDGERKKIIVNYCGFRDQKNLPLLISAFSRIALKYGDYQLRIYGEGAQRESLQKSIDEAHLTDRIALLPFDPQIHEKIADYAMFVMTSDYEGMPNSLIEAMGIGLPCISTDCDGGGARAVIENGVNGILVPKGDIDVVAAAMEDLIAHPEKAERLSKNAVKIREMLAVDRIAEQWLKLAE